MTIVELELVGLNWGLGFLIKVAGYCYWSRVIPTAYPLNHQFLLVIPGQLFHLFDHLGEKMCVGLKLGFLQSDTVYGMK